jgi:hypothetical protein
MLGNYRHPLPPRAAKRKAEGALKQDNSKKPRHDPPVIGNSVDDDHDDVGSPVTLSYRWIDEGTPLANGQTEHTLLETIVDGKMTMIALGDTVLLQSGATMGSDPNDAFIAKVERMWQAPPRRNVRREDCMHIRVRWFFKVR